MRSVIVGSACLVLSSCIIEHRVYHAPGTATIRWSVEGSFDPRACDAQAAATAAVDVFYADGGLVASATPYCSYFDEGFALGDGWYSAAVTLLDRNGAPVSTTVRVPPFSVRSDFDTPVEVDFPPSSFYVPACPVHDGGGNR